MATKDVPRYDRSARALARLLAMAGVNGPDPLLVPLLHLARRLSSGTPPGSDLERACADVVGPDAAHLAPLGRLAHEFFELPPPARARVTPPALAILTADEPLTGELARRAAAEAVPRPKHPAATPVGVLPGRGPYRSGDSVTLLVRGFDGRADDLVATVVPLGAVGAPARSALLRAGLGASSAGMLEVRLPPGLPQETDLVVEVGPAGAGSLGHDRGDHLDIAVEAWRWPLFWDPPVGPQPPPAPPDPTIATVGAPDRRAGETVVIEGSDFAPKTGGLGSTVHVEALQEGTFAVHVPVDGTEDAEGWRATLLPGTPGKIELQLGFDVPPGQLTVAVSTSGPGGVGFSDRVAYLIRPWIYSVAFKRLRCLDESNEWSSADEVVVTWVVAVDDEVGGRTSHEYGSVDEGDTIDFVGNDAAPLFKKPVRKQLVLATHLAEWDDPEGGPISQSRPFQASAQLAGAIAQQGGTPGAIAAAVGVVMLVVVAIVEAFADADDLGTQTLSLSARDLVAQTQAPDRTLRGTLAFTNADSEGSHEVDFEVVRSA